jgi:peptidyl-prolyl cis-trans isomerase A (cyclophilin A)
MAQFATLKTSLGDIRVKLMPEHAPKTVANFVELATGKRTWRDPKTGKERNDALYDGTTFHRVIKDFMIQGGCPLGTGTGGPGYQFEDETHGGPVFDRPGLLAMANSGPNTNGSQFFITEVPTTWLNYKHTIFGEVVSGFDVVQNIAASKTHRDRPDPPITVSTIEIEEA